MEMKIIQNRQNNFEKEKLSWRGSPTGFKTYYKVTVMKTVLYWSHQRQIDQWIRIKGLEIDHKYMTTDFS